MKNNVTVQLVTVGVLMKVVKKSRVREKVPELGWLNAVVSKYQHYLIPLNSHAPFVFALLLFVPLILRTFAIVFQDFAHTKFFVKIDLPFFEDLCSKRAFSRNEGWIL